MQTHYLRFFLPLAATSVLFVIGNQARNGILARYPDPARHLSTYAYALSAFAIFWSANNFVPQLNNVFARSAQGHRVARNAVWLVNIGSTSVLLLLALTPLGTYVFGRVFHIKGALLQQVQFYVGIFAPLLPLAGQARLLEGLLVQSGCNRLVTLAQFIDACVLVTTLWVAFSRHVPPMAALLASHYAALLTSLGVLTLLYKRYYALPAEAAYTTLTYREVLRFLWPTIVTSLMFTLSRPVLYACLSRTEQPLIAVAALRISYDVLAAVQQVSNQFRHFFVSFGDQEDLPGKRNFMRAVAVALTLILGLSVLPPIRDWVYGAALGLQGAILTQTVAATTVMLCGPALLTTRNYYHGRLLARTKPRGMAAGAILRVAVLCASGLILLKLGYLNTSFAAVSLLLGFMAEVLISRLALRRTLTADELRH